MRLQTCISPAGKFVYGVHDPHFKVTNLREGEYHEALGRLDDGKEIFNHRNFPESHVQEDQADSIFEIPNPLPFRGVTYICRSWADSKVGDLAAIALPAPSATSYNDYLRSIQAGDPLDEEQTASAFRNLPESVMLALAATSTDPADLVRLAGISCSFSNDPDNGRPMGLKYTRTAGGRTMPAIHNHALFEVLVNNPHLPDSYKKCMVLRPGVQGGSEIVGEWGSVGGTSHIFEYLRRNSYIPWGHYAANMADDAVRYQINDLSLSDMRGLRHLFYQRTYVRLAGMLGIPLPDMRRTLTEEELETLRLKIITSLKEPDARHGLQFTATLWGWNFGFDYSPTHYRLHASHQQIHQQYALLPETVNSRHDTSDQAAATIPSFGCGDLVADFIRQYQETTGRPFFDAYLEAIRTNSRMDGRPDQPSSLIIYEDEQVILFVPKAQTSQWEIQLMPLQRVGNILEADKPLRKSLDYAILVAQKILAGLGARMVTSIEFPKRFNDEASDQRLLYAFLPKLPQSMGAFSEAQLRYINGHYPEDFAAACRSHLDKIISEIGAKQE